MTNFVGVTEQMTNVIPEELKEQKAEFAGNGNENENPENRPNKKFKAWLNAYWIRTILSKI